MVQIILGPTEQIILGSNYTWANVTNYTRANGTNYTQATGTNYTQSLFPVPVKESELFLRLLKLHYTIAQLNV